MSVSQLEKEFINPSSAYRGKPFWAWNGSLEESELRRQIRIFQRMGLGGFFMHSRVGLKTPYLSAEWFEMVRACIDEAVRTDTQAWLYDEDRWPSGAAGGLVTRDPKFQNKFLTMARFSHPERFDWPRDQVAFVYGATFEDEKIGWYKKLDQPADILILPQGAEVIQFSLKNASSNPWFNDCTYLDTLSREAVEKFIAVTHEAYRNQVGDHFGKAVPGIFTDEPNTGWAFRKWWTQDSELTIPWTLEFPERFQTWFGYDLLQHLPELVFEIVDKPYSRARYHYYRCRTQLFVENFMQPIGAWCEKNHLLFTGHVLEEEPPSRSVSVLGSAMQCYPAMQAPGIDVLTQYRLELIAAKQCSSVARQTGRKWVLSELYGCTGWESTFEMYKHSGDWQAALGITLRCPHLSWYSMAGEAKRDYPASIHFQSPWWRQYRFVEDYFSRLNVILSEGEAVCDLAVLHPIESFYLVHGPNWETRGSVRKMDQDIETLVKWLLGAHLDFDFADEQLLVELGGRVERDSAGPFLQIGKMRYRALLVPSTITLRRTTLDLLRQFDQAGGKVVFVESAAELLDAEPSGEVRAFAQGKTVPSAAASIVGALQDKVRRVSIRDGQGQEINDLLYQFRRIGEDWVVFLVNTNRERGFSAVHVRLNLELPRGGQIQVWDAASGQTYKIAGELTYRSAAFKIDLPPSGSRLVVISSQPRDLPSPVIARPADQPVQLGADGWSFFLDDYNVVVLDRPDCQAQAAGKKKFARTRTEILSLDRELRAYLEIRPRGGAMVQPWVRRDQPLRPTLPITLTYRFNVRQIPPAPILLALEQPDRWRIQINGREIDSDLTTGWWVDPAIQTIAVRPELLVQGKNLLTLEGSFDRLTNLEIIYLLGSFGVTTDGKTATITRFPSRLALGSWIDKGLPFYCGNVTYRTTFEFQPDGKSTYLLRVAKFAGTAVEATLNDTVLPLMAWPEYQVDCTAALTAGKNRLDIKILGNRRNGFGPLHLAPDAPLWIGPDQFLPNAEHPQNWQEEYKLFDLGLYEPPTLIASET